MVSGHRRLHAAVKAGLTEVPAFDLSLDRNEAMIAVVDSNLHRERILPSEKAFALQNENGGNESAGQADGFNFVASCDKVGPPLKSAKHGMKAGTSVPVYPLNPSCLPNCSKR